ncbi:DUF2924 domain-containing protein [Lysobacter antibioticus]|uniref:DUF2924 domain-containing protein n=1 Tax=Lysobacter antibioticus TaxID=84531 RepID=UPI0009DFEFF2|nr:DUF2924 domain-containing protein [Lysobacter antibioticus]
MKRSTSPPSKVCQRIAALQDLKWNELKALWKDLFGREPSINNRRYVERRLTHRLQELAAQEHHADLLQSNDRRIRHLLQTGTIQPNKGKALRSGAVLTRSYRGVLHSVRALDDGRFEYGGRQYRSLSVIAREITGTRWSGPAFFGLHQPNQKKELPK